MVIGLEYIECLGVIQGAGHDVPWQVGIVFFTRGDNGFGEYLEECFVSDRADRVVALGAVESEACSLSACDYKSGNFASG